MLLLGGKKDLFCLGKTGLLGGFDPGERLLIVFALNGSANMLIIIQFTQRFIW